MLVGQRFTLTTGEIVTVSDVLDDGSFKFQEYGHIGWRKTDVGTGAVEFEDGSRGEIVKVHDMYFAIQNSELTFKRVAMGYLWYREKGVYHLRYNDVAANITQMITL